MRDRLATAVVAALLVCGPVLAGEGAPPVTVVERGVPKAAIVIADQPDPVGISVLVWKLDRKHSVRLAAEYLQSFVKRVSGAELPIVAASRAPTEGTLILVGRSSLTAEVEGDRRNLPAEGFLIRSSGKRVYIVGEVAAQGDLREYAGADRGTLFGVFEFLERFCGVRWYFPGELGTVVPRLSEIRVPSVSFTDAPAYAMRYLSMYYGLGKDPMAAPIPVYRMGNSTGFHSCHTYDDWPGYAKEHPEFFAVDRDGRSTIPEKPATGHKYYRICFSEPGVFQTDLQRVRDFYERGVRHWDSSMCPTEKYVRFFPQDLENIYHCHCPRCQAQWDRDPSHAWRQSPLSELIFGYAARFAAALDQQYPGKRLAVGAYCAFLFPPLKTRLPENVDVFLCTVKGNSLLALPAYYEYNTRLVNEWSAHLNRRPERLYLWEYFCYPNAECFQLYPHAMQRWFRQNRGKIGGAFNNTRNLTAEPIVGRFHVINGWLWCKLLWNPDIDVDAALGEMYARLFGPARSPMQALFDLCVSRWEPKGVKLEKKDLDPVKDLNPGVVSYVNDARLYRRIYPREIIAELRERLKEAENLAPPESVYARRVEYFAEPLRLFFRNADAFCHPQKTSDKPSAQKATPKPP